MVLDTVMTTLHVLTGALWVGSVVFVAGVVLPAALDGSLDAAPLETFADRLVYGSRAASVVMFLTGGHMAGTGYTFDLLLNSSRGHLVLAMLFLWLVLSALVEIGRSRLVEGLQEKRVRSPARNAMGVFRAAAVVGVLLLVNAGLLASDVALY
ncbi:CopD family protein [Halogeometricum sp. CBA1124]|uniref:CopD family protein n=1 Tax=Halogeometricum sp. CBA1124 TaxID=2668071 RepID=UPI00142D039B|nr:CopD family protein [Halogeometricum sp. CBA1124]MUV58751.1 copper resistance protein CopD [Halogeometricum sp. CBA1124]